MTTAPTLEQPSAYFDRLAEVEAAHWWSLGMWRLAARWLSAALRGRRVLAALDVGCGAGLTASRLAALAEVGSVTGLEPSPEALGLARRHRGLRLVRGSALRLPFDDATFDVVTCFDVIQHLPAGGDRRAASELRRVLRPGGVVLVRSNARGRSSPRLATGGGYRLGELADVFDRAGLAVRRASYANCLPALAQELRGRWARPGRGVPGHPAGGGLRIRLPHPWVNRLMTGVAAVEAAAAARLDGGLPYGHSTMILARRDA